MSSVTRKTIGVVLDWLVFGDNPLYYQTAILKGIDAFCRERDYNLAAFTIGRLDSPLEREKINGFLINMVTLDNVDGAIVLPSIGFFSGKKRLRSYLDSLAPLPLVALGNRFDDITSVVIDNYSAMKQVVSHLVGFHGLRRIAFITGKNDNHDAEERYRAYKDALREHGIEFDDRLVVSGAYVVQSGIDAVEALLAAALPFDAVVAANDQMAIGAIRAFESRGIYNFPVTGFDNIDGARRWSLTTVDQNLFHEGYLCAEIVSEMIEGHAVEKVYVVEGTLKLRSSCGCDVNVKCTKDAEVAVNDAPETDDECARLCNALLGEISDPLQKETFVSLIGRIEAEIRPDSDLQPLVRLWESIMKLCQKEHISSDLQLCLFEALCSKMETAGLNEKQFRRQMVSIGYLTGRYSEDFSQQYSTHSDSISQSIDYLSEDLFDTLELKKQADLLYEKLASFGIENCLISRYLDYANPLSLSLPILSYTVEGRMDCTGAFQTASLFPTDFSSSLRKQRYSLLVQPFSCGSKPIGYIAATINDVSDKALLLSRNRINIAIKESLYIESLEKEITMRNDELVQTNERLTRSLQKNRLLMRELEHRVKNNLGVVAGLLNLEAISAERDDVRSVLIEARTRIEVMAAIYERLYTRPHVDNKIDAGPYIEDLVSSLLPTYSLGRTDVRLVFSSEKCYMDFKRIISLGLLVNELVSNSLKYAWPNCKTGTLEIRLVRQGKQYRLSICDDGIGLSQEMYSTQSKTLGLVLVRSFAEELGAELVISGTEGTKVTLLFS